MISLCTMGYGFFGTYERVLLDYVANRSKLVSEVCITLLDTEKSYKEEVIKAADGREIVVKRRGMPLDEVCGAFRSISSTSYGHPIGLHTSLDMATKEYVIMQDMDVFWYEAVDQFYYDMFKKYDLNIVGLSHPWAHGICFTFFPTVISCMVKRDTLPGKDWLKGKLFAKPDAEAIRENLGPEPQPNTWWIVSKHGRVFGPEFHDVQTAQEAMAASCTPIEDYTIEKVELYKRFLWVPLDGYWLIPSPILEYMDRFPNKTDVHPIYDIGCNLWLWNQDRNGRWLSWQTLDCHNYSKAVCRGNFKVKDRMPNTKFAYHLTSGYNEALQETNKVQEFADLYEASK